MGEAAWVVIYRALTSRGAQHRADHRGASRAITKEVGCASLGDLRCNEHQAEHGKRDDQADAAQPP